MDRGGGSIRLRQSTLLSLTLHSLTKGENYIDVRATVGDSHPVD